MKAILKWDVKRMFNALKALINGEEDALIEWFGKDNWEELLKVSDGDKESAMEWVREVSTLKVNNTYKLLVRIKELTKDNEEVQRALKAIGL